MGQCFARLNASRAQDVSDPQTDREKKVSGKRPVSPYHSRIGGSTSAAPDSSLGSGGGETIPSYTSKRPCLDRWQPHGAYYIRSAAIDEPAGDRIFSRDASPTSAHPYHFKTPGCPNNTPMVPTLNNSQVMSDHADLDLPCYPGAPTHSSTPSRSDPSQSMNTEVNLTTISRKLDKLDKTLREHTAQLTCLSSDTTRILDHSQLYTTATGSFIDSSVISPPGPGYHAPLRRGVQVFEGLQASARLETPRPYPRHPGLSPLVKTNLLPAFEEAVSGGDNQDVSQDSDINLDDTVTPAMPQSPEEPTTQ